MKYLKKLFESNETDELEEIIKPLINFYLIDDLKELSLEHLDNEMILQYSISYYCRYSYRWIISVEGQFSHIVENFNYMELSEQKVETYLHNWHIPIKYVFRVETIHNQDFIVGGEGRIIKYRDPKNNKINKEILNIIKNIYPQEEIEVF